MRSKTPDYPKLIRGLAFVVVCWIPLLVVFLVVMGVAGASPLARAVGSAAVTAILLGALSWQGRRWSRAAKQRESASGTSSRGDASGSA